MTSAAATVRVQNSTAKKLFHITPVYSYNRIPLLTCVIFRLAVSPEENVGSPANGHPGQLSIKLIIFK